MKCTFCHPATRLDFDHTTPKTQSCGITLPKIDSNHFTGHLFLLTAIADTATASLVFFSSSSIIVGALIVPLIRLAGDHNFGGS